MKTDLQIAQENTMDNIEKIARKAKIDPDYLEVYGKNKAKIDLKIMDKIADNRNGDQSDESRRRQIDDYDRIGRWSGSDQ